MDAADISVQVLSLTSPGAEQLEASDAITLARDSERLPCERSTKTSGSLGGICNPAHRRT